MFAIAHLFENGVNHVVSKVCEAAQRKDEQRMAEYLEAEASWEAYLAKEDAEWCAENPKWKILLREQMRQQSSPRHKATPLWLAQYRIACLAWELQAKSMYEDLALAEAETFLQAQQEQLRQIEQQRLNAERRRKEPTPHPILGTSYRRA